MKVAKSEMVFTLHTDDSPLEGPFSGFECVVNLFIRVRISGGEPLTLDVPKTTPRPAASSHQSTN